MLKRIHIDQLRIGMYVHGFDGSWINHPFWRSAFLLDNFKDLQAIQSTGMSELWIDTDRGRDVDDGGATEADARVAEDEQAQGDATVSNVQHVAIDQEAVRAIKICDRSRQAITSMFQEARMGKALQAADALPIVEEISASVMRNPGALISLARVKNRDEYTYMHSVAVCALMVSLAHQLGLDETQTRHAGMAGLLHDVGKMRIPLEILNKPGRLTSDEFDLIKTHPEEGYRMLQEGTGICDMALDVCLHHHEKLDGTGYPEKLASEQISMYARMGAVCDVYDAVTSNRPYRDGWDPAESIRKMAEWCDTQFDRRIFEAFVRSIGIYPIGSLVRLESKRLGVVIDQTARSLLTPRVKVFFSISSNCRIPPEILDLSKTSCNDSIVSREDPAVWGIRDINELWSGLPFLAE